MNFLNSYKLCTPCSLVMVSHINYNLLNIIFLIEWNENMITTVILDIGNVLVDFAWKEHIARMGYSKEINDRIAKATALNEDWNQYDVGLLTDEEILDLFVENDPGIGDQILSTFATLTGLLKQKEHAKDFIKELKAKGYRVLYLSNFSAKAEKDCAKELDFIPLTDGGILSYKVRIIKPDQRIYELLTQTYGLTPEECIFFDDTPANVEAAKKHGYNAEVFVDYETALKHIYEH